MMKTSERDMKTWDIIFNDNETSFQNKGIAGRCVDTWLHHKQGIARCVALG